MSFYSLFRLSIAVALIGSPMHFARAYVIFPPDGSFAGKSIVDWTADWWTWALQSPAATNPLLDATGAFANVNNDGPVFFVAGTVSGSTPRSFEVPAGKPILLPIINLFDVESVPPDPPEATLADRERAADLVVGAFLDAVDKSSLFASIDGTPVANPSAYLEVTGYFDMGPTQPGSLLEALGLPAGTEAFPTKSGGYWLMVGDLTPGLHELHFGGSSGDWSVDTGTPIGTESGAGFSTETTDLINVVVPEPTSAALCLPWVLALLGFWRGPRLISRSHRAKCRPRRAYTELGFVTATGVGMKGGKG